MRKSGSLGPIYKWFREEVLVISEFLKNCPDYNEICVKCVRGNQQYDAILLRDKIEEFGRLEVSWPSDQREKSIVESEIDKNGFSVKVIDVFNRKNGFHYGFPYIIETIKRTFRSKASKNYTPETVLVVKFGPPQPTHFDCLTVSSRRLADSENTLNMFKEICEWASSLEYKCSKVYGMGFG